MRSSVIILVCALAQAYGAQAYGAQAHGAQEYGAQEDALEDASWQLDFESRPIGSTIVTVTMLLPAIIACLFEMI